MRYLLLLVLMLFYGGAVLAQQLNDKLFMPSANASQPFNDTTVFTPVAKPSPTDAPPRDEHPLWCGGLEFGLNGSEGNSDVMKMRFGANARRRTEANLLTVDLVYGMARQNGIQSENKALFNVRDEILLRDSPWGVFASGQLEYDEFRDFDFRVASHAGMGYQVWRTERCCLRTRLGAGFSREIGGPRDRWVPEGLAGADFDYRFTERQRFVSTVDLFPDLGHWGQYRLRFRAAHEILIDPDLNMTLRLGVQDRYDSNPGGSLRNDIDYFLALMMKF